MSGTEAMGAAGDVIGTATPIIQNFESFSARAYPDPAGQSEKWSIGWGHQIRAGDPYDSTSEIGRDEGDALLRVDVAGAWTCVSQHVENIDSLTTNALAALVSFAYNVGCRAFSDSTLLARINAGDLQGAADQFPLWVHANGVVNSSLQSRRAQEQELFLA